MSRPGDDQRLQRIWQRAAPSYDRSMEFIERLLFKGARAWVCDRARGDVLEIAVGTGRNLGLYAPDVRLTGVDVSPDMLAIALRRARELGVTADLRRGNAEALELPDARFDTVVCTLALCSIPDDRRALREMHRVLRPGGRLLLLEHVRSPNPVIRAIERLLDPLLVRLQADHLLRDPLDHLGPIGFDLDELRRSKLGLVELVSAYRRR